MLSGGDHSALPSLAENFLDLLPVAVYICDAAGIIRYFNRRARRSGAGRLHAAILSCGSAGPSDSSIPMAP